MKTKRNRNSVWDRKGLESDGDGDRTQAHTAAASGDIPLLIKSVQQNPDQLEQRDADGRTPLAHAVHAQQLLAVKRLVKMGADVNTQDSEGRTCLAIAAYQGWHECVVYLLRKGASHSIGDKSGRKPLHASTYDTDPRSMSALLHRLAAEDVNDADNEKMTALHWATFHNRPDHVRLLLAKGANPLAKDVDGKTPLHWAAQNGSRKCSAILLDHMPEVGLGSRTDGAGKTPVHLAAAAGQVALLYDLAQCTTGALDAVDTDNRTPLHWAAAMGHGDCVKALLHLGSAADPVDVEGATPLDYAIQARHKQCRQLLEERHAPVEAADRRHQPSVVTVRTSKASKNPVGFLKGLFHKKHKTDAKQERAVVESSSQLPAVTSNGHTGVGGPGVNTSRDQWKVGVHGEKKQKRNKPMAGAVREWDVDSVNTFDTTDTRDTRDTRDSRDTGEGTGELGRPRKHRKYKRKEKHKLDTDRDSSRPKSIRTQSSWNEEAGMSSLPQSVLKSMHLSPLGFAKAPTISPRVAQESSALINSDVLALRRQGELSPLAEARLPDAICRMNGQPLSSNLTGLKKERMGGSRSPTPPPHLSLNIHAKKALPGISPLVTRKNRPPDTSAGDTQARTPGGRQATRDVYVAPGNTRLPELASLHEEEWSLTLSTCDVNNETYDITDGHSRNINPDTFRVRDGDDIPLFDLRQALNDPPQNT